MKILLTLCALALVACKTTRPQTIAPPRISTVAVVDRIDKINASLDTAVKSNRDGKSVVRSISGRAELIDYKTSLLEGLLK